MQDKTNSNQYPIIDQLFGECSAIQSICKQIKLIAPTDCTVLVVGETGTGKSLIAQYIFSLSKRADNTLVTMNCTTSPETKVEAEIFGYNKKILTGHNEPSLKHLSTLNGATLLIDEISELSEEAQAHFLEVLELIEKRNLHSDTPIADIRIIATSQQDLMTLVQQNKFNKRLYYHLNVFNIYIPPIRDRGEDKIRLAERLLVESCKKHSKPLQALSNDAAAKISEYLWPGNFRELRNTIERSVVLSETNKIFTSILGLDTFHETPKHTPEPTPTNHQTEAVAEPADKTGRNENLSLEDYFQHFVLEHQNKMTETELAQKLGISRKCLWERRQRLGIPKRKQKK